MIQAIPMPAEAHAGAATLAAARSSVVVRRLGWAEYSGVWHAMRAFTEQRQADTVDEIWLVEHPPVFTLGLNCQSRVRDGAAQVPVIVTDRGGQMTYHGPGQLVAYVLMDLKRRRLGVRGFVSSLEQAVIDLLAGYGIEAKRRARAPGVYVADRKIAALGIRVRRGASYHGLSLNVAMDLAPFKHIDPCGYADLEVTQLADLGVNLPLAQVGDGLIDELATQLEFGHVSARPPVKPGPKHRQAR